MVNIAKNRQFLDTMNSIYGIYKLSKVELNQFIKTWYPESRNGMFDKVLNKPRYYSEFWTVVKCDYETRRVLYGKIYNPISVSISHTIKDELYFSVGLESIDDGGYYINVYNISLPDAEKMQKYVMEYVSSQKIINGTSLIHFCEELFQKMNYLDYIIYYD